MNKCVFFGLHAAHAPEPLQQRGTRHRHVSVTGRRSNVKGWASNMPWILWCTLASHVRAMCNAPQPCTNCAEVKLLYAALSCHGYAWRIQTLSFPALPPVAENPAPHNHSQYSKYTHSFAPWGCIVQRKENLDTGFNTCVREPNAALTALSCIPRLLAAAHKCSGNGLPFYKGTTSYCLCKCGWDGPACDIPAPVYSVRDTSSSYIFVFCSIYDTELIQ